MNNHYNFPTRSKLVNDKLIYEINQLFYTLIIVFIAIFLSLTLSNNNNYDHLKNNNTFWLTYSNNNIVPGIDIIYTNINLHMNGYNHTTNAIVDTGSSMVVIPYLLAKKFMIGYILNSNLCNHIMTRTSNGNRVACLVKINKITLGKCNAYNIDAIIYKHHKETDIPLLGMSFLNIFKLEMINGIFRIYC